MIMVIYLLTALFLGGFGNYLIPLMVGARDMVFPVCEYAELLDLPARGAGSGLDLLCAGRTHRRRLDAVSTAGNSLRKPGSGGRHHSDAGVADPVHHRLHDGRAELCGDGAAGSHPRMTLMRMPLTVWGIFTATVMALLAFPGVVCGCVMMLLDRLLGTSFFMPALVEMGQQSKYGGGSPLLFQHLFWFFGHPEVYIVALPAFGIVSDLISTHARKNIFGYRMMVWAIVGIGALSFVVWAHHMYVSGMNPHFGFFFATTTLIIAVPTAIKVYNWVLTLWRGDIHLTDADAVRAGFHRHFREWRPDRLVPRQCGGGCSVVRHDVRGRSFPHGDGRCADHGGVWRHLSLVSESHRANAARRRSENSTSGSRSLALMRFSSRCTISACWACRAAIMTLAKPLSSRLRP